MQLYRFNNLPMTSWNLEQYHQKKSVNILPKMTIWKVKHFFGSTAVIFKRQKHVSRSLWTSSSGVQMVCFLGIYLEKELQTDPHRCSKHAYRHPTFIKHSLPSYAGSPHRQVRVLAAEVRQEAQRGLREVVAEWQEHNPKFLLELRKSHWVIFANIGKWEHHINFASVNV